MLEHLTISGTNFQMRVKKVQYVTWSSKFCTNIMYRHIFSTEHPWEYFSFTAYRFTDFRIRYVV